MRVRMHLLMFAIACLVIGGCTIPGVTINVDQDQTPPHEATAPPVQEVVQPTTESPESQPAQPKAAPSPIPTALVDPELAALWNYALTLQKQVVQPLEEMGTALEELGLGSGEADIFAVCTGIDVVVATLAEVQQGVAQVSRPPVDDADLQECYAELIAAMDDLEQGFQLLQTACQTKNLGAVLEAANYLESGAQHMDNAAQAMERWQAKVGL